MKLYTKTGDDGSTGLVHGQRASKDCPRIEACGAIDHLNSVVGMAVVVCRHQGLSAVLRRVQNRLFDLGADLMTIANEGKESAGEARRIGPSQITEAERQIDDASAHLPPLDQFILPGGCELAARLHVARTACRLAERRAVALARQETVCSHLVVYLNRLSDLLFALARRANQLEGVDDVVWTRGGDQIDPA